jgi:hypothetical protein
MEISLNALRPLSAALLAFALLAPALLPARAIARPETTPAAQPVVDPLDAVLDPAWKPPEPPKPPPAPEKPAVTAATQPATVKEEPKPTGYQQREDAPGYHSLFNASLLPPELEKKEGVGLLAAAGLATIDDATHVQLAASVYFSNYFIIGGVLNHALSSENPAYPKGKNRLADFDEWRDWFRFLQKWESPLDNGGAFKAGRLSDASQGESGLLQHLSNDLLADTPRLGLSLEVRRSTWWLSALISDATWLAPVVGGQVGLAPLGNSESAFLSSFKVSAYYAGDLRAPTALVHTAGGPIAVEEEHRPQDTNELLHGYGADVRVRPLDSEHLYADLYGAYNQLVGQGNGLHAGVRLGARSEVASLELKGEVRMLGAHYLPHYFDSFYDVQRSSYLSGDPGTASLTKLGYLRTLDRDGRLQTYLAGARLFLSGMLGLEATYETGADSLLGTATLHAQVNVGSEFSVFATYQRRNFGTGGEWFKFDSNELLVGRIRVKLSEGFWVTGFATRTFVWDAAAGEGAYKPAWSGGAQAAWVWGG